jgi:hypothetical protein
MVTRHRECPGVHCKVIGMAVYKHYFLLRIFVAVTGDGDHVNSKNGRGSTWDYCSVD